MEQRIAAIALSANTQDARIDALRYPGRTSGPFSGGGFGSSAFGGGGGGGGPGPPPNNPAGHFRQTPAPQQPKYNAKFMTFDYSDGPDSHVEFERFETNVIVVSDTMGYTPPRVFHAIIAQCRGRAQDIAKSLLEDDLTFVSMDQFLTRMRKLFVSPAHAAKAKAIFHSRHQKPKESIVIYHAALQVLYKRAFSATQRNMDEHLLIHQFIGGIQNIRINEILLMQQADAPLSYQDLLPKALTLQGVYETAEYQAKCRAMGRSSSVSQVAPHPRPTSYPRGVEPMEVDALSVAAIKKRRPPPRRSSSFNKSTSKCRNCQRTGHQTIDCYTQSRPPSSKRNSGARSVRPRSSTRSSFRRKQGTTTSTSKRGSCRNCGQFGHWAANCPKKRKGRRSVGALGTEDESEHSETDFFATDNESNDCSEDETTESEETASESNPKN
jgi:hypothetical protein